MNRRAFLTTIGAVVVGAGAMAKLLPQESIHVRFAKSHKFHWLYDGGRWHFCQQYDPDKFYYSDSEKDVREVTAQLRREIALRSR